MIHQGFSPALQTSADLLAKLHHDLDRMKADPLDAYAAYDFFVTASHLGEWSPRGSIDPCLLALLEHLAGGAKQFRPADLRHASVADVKTVSGAFDERAVEHNVFVGGGLVIELDGDASMMFGREVSAVLLAQQALAVWEVAFS